MASNLSISEDYSRLVHLVVHEKCAVAVLEGSVGIKDRLEKLTVSASLGS